MKNIFLLAILIVASHTLIAQSSYSPRPLGSYSSDFVNVVSNTVVDTNLQSHFLLGWNWASIGSKLDSALHINFYHQALLEHLSNPTEMNPNIKAAVCALKPNGWETRLLATSWNTPSLLNTESIWFHPEITVDTTENFTPRPGDTTGAVFGWRRKKYGTAGTGRDQNRWIIPTSSISAPRDTILSNAWKTNALSYMDWVVISPRPEDYATGFNNSTNPTLDSNFYQPTNMRKLYLTVNLRTVNAAQLNALPDTAKILAIRLPYTLYNDSLKISTQSVIKFDSLPNASISPFAVYTLVGRNPSDNRGIVRKLVATPTQPTEFIITKAMLRGQDSNGITLNAYFHMRKKNGLVYVFNPLLRPETWENQQKITEYIKDLRVEVYGYAGGADIALDYVRIGSQMSKQIYEGQYDKNIDDSLSYTMQMFQNSATNQSSARIARFYGVEERSHAWWGLSRYFNHIVGGNAAMELGTLDKATGGNLPTQGFLHATGHKEFWTGGNIAFTIENPAPYIRSPRMTGVGAGCVPSVRGFGYWAGYAGNMFDTLRFGFRDTLNSHYETYSEIRQSTNWFSPFTTITENSYLEKDTAYYYGLQGLQFKIEQSLHNHYYIARGMLYSDKPWWQNNWTTSDQWREDTLNGSFMNAGLRPLTGEETRFKVTASILLGAKGLIHYLKWTQADWNGNMQIGVHAINDSLLSAIHNMSDSAAMYSESIGGDWIDIRDSTILKWKYHWRPGHANYDWNSLGIDSNHIYIGMKSTRVELFKAHQFIKTNESELIRLRLHAWYGKGYMRLYSQKQSYPISDTILKSRYINLTQVKTRPLGRTMLNGKPMYEQFSIDSNGVPIDSGFYDITLLKHDSLSLDSVFYIGALNRRTDPLWHDTTYANGEMVHVPTAEFDTLIVSGGRLWKDTTWKTAAWWREKFWKRQGCREITLPFNYRHIDRQWRFLRVQELTRQGQIGIDTTICQDCPLAVRFLPGEGKIFRVTVKRPVAYDITSMVGSLESNSQRKLVTVPLCLGPDSVTGEPLYDSSKVVHHLVFHRKDTVDSTSGIRVMRRRVWYTRSEAIDVCSPQDVLNPTNGNLGGITWLPPIVLTDSLYIYDSPTQRTLINYGLQPDCFSPSLTVRWDPTNFSEYAYITYACYSCDATSPTTLTTRYIGESIVESIGSSIIKGKPNTIFTYAGMNNYTLEKFGGPVVNAALEGNYVIFADTSVGLRTLYLDPNHDNRRYINFAKEGTLSWFRRNSLAFPPPIWKCTTGVASNPTVNTFTNPLDGTGKGCSIAWQEELPYYCTIETDTIRLNNIYFARLDPNHLSGMVVHPGTQNLDGLTVCSDSTIVRLSHRTSLVEGFVNHQRPSIAQMSEPSHDGIYNSAFVAWDAVKQDTANNIFLNGIFGVSLWFVDSVGVPKLTFNSSPHVRTWSTAPYNRAHVSLLRQSDGLGSYGTTPNIFALNAWLSNSVVQPFGLNRLTWTFTGYPFIGSNPHLSAQPMTSWRTSMNDYAKTIRRVLNIGSSGFDTSSIRNSFQLLFKGEQEQWEVMTLVGYRYDKGGAYFYEPSSRETTTQVCLKESQRAKQKQTLKLMFDTEPIVGAWHTVNDYSTIPVIFSGSELQSTSIVIENKRTGKSVPLNIKSIRQSGVPLKTNVLLRNGGGDEYRVVMTNQKESSFERVLDLYIGTREYAAKETEFSSNDITVDLAETIDIEDETIMRAYPNPNDGSSIFLMVHPNTVRNTSGEYTVSVRNIVGDDVLTLRLTPDNTIELPTSTLANGVYSVMVEYTTHVGHYKRSTGRFIILR